MKDDSTLLRGYTEERSEADFSELVCRHIDLVYSTALRQVNGDVHLAQDVTSLVFTDLARKASSLAGRRVLAGWLFTSTRFAAIKLVRGARRRKARDQAALLMQDHSPTDAPLDWERVRPVLDEALGELDERDREAILLRFMGGCGFAEVGARLALSENAARMRVDRALDKLRALLARRGATSTAAALSLALANQAVVAAPAGLTASVTSAALASTGAAATLTFMSLTKLQLALAGAVLVTGAGFYTVQEKDNAALRAELAGLASAPQAREEIARLRQANRQLETTARRVTNLQVSEAELARLRAEVAAQQQRLQAMARLEARRSRVAPPGAPVGDAVAPAALDAIPKPISLPPPAYPADMAAAGIEGTVVVAFIVDYKGKVIDARPVESSRPEFEAAALAAVLKWEFDAGRRGGQNVTTRLTQKIEFKLPGGIGAASPPPDWF